MLYLLWDIPIIMSMLYLNWQVKKNLERVLEEGPGYLEDTYSNNSAIDDDLLEANRLSEVLTSRGSGVHYTKDLVCFSRAASFNRQNEDINSSLKHPEMAGSDADGTAEFSA